MPNASSERSLAKPTKPAAPPPRSSPRAKATPLPFDGDTYDAVIVGAGLAGCSLAIDLARGGHRVLLLERQSYPAHKLCGEFLSTEVIGLFERLGVMEAVREGGAREIVRSRLTGIRGPVYDTALPGTALGFSRFALDKLLFDAARGAGAEAYDGTLVEAVTQPREPDELHRIATARGVARARIVLGAYGKRSRLDGHLGRDFVEKPSPLVGMKAHFEPDPETHSALQGWIELHAFDGGYCGISHVESASGAPRVNVCWIADEAALRRAGKTPEAMLAGPLRKNPHLAARLDAMTRVTEFCATSQVTFAYKGTEQRGVCLVGDTVGMIAPMCGDGMAMALHAAALAAPLADGYLRGDSTRADFDAAYESAWTDVFGTRLGLSRHLHRAYVRPSVTRAALHGLRVFPRVGDWFVRKTRG